MTELTQEKPRGLAWLTAMAAGLVAFAIALALMAHGWAGAGKQAAPWQVLWPYWLTFALVWSVLTVGLWRLGRVADRWRGVGSIVLLLALAALVRGGVIFGSAPVLSDHLNQYLAQGASLTEGRNPYAQGPEDAQASEAIASADSPRSANKGDRQSQRGVIYQPAAQYVFAGFTALHHQVTQQFGPEALSRATTFRLGMVGFDLLILVLLIGRLRASGRSIWWAALWGLHPLVISELAGSAHQDVIGITALLGGLLLVERAQGRLAWAALGGLAWAMAVAVNPLVAPVALPVAWSMRRWRGGLITTALAGAAGLVALYLPFVFMPGSSGALVQSVEPFARQSVFNSSAYAVVNPWLGDELSRLLMPGVAVLAMVLSMWRSDEKLFRPTALYFLVIMLTTPTLHPWYVLWGLVFLPLTFDAALWALSATIMISYVALHHPQDATVTWWIKAPPLKVIEFAPVYALALLGWLTGWGVRKPVWLQPVRGVVDGVQSASAPRSAAKADEAARALSAFEHEPSDEATESPATDPERD